MEVGDGIEFPLKSVFDGSEYILIATTIFKSEQSFKINIRCKFSCSWLKCSSFFLKPNSKHWIMGKSNGIHGNRVARQDCELNNDVECTWDRRTMGRSG